MQQLLELQRKSAVMCAVEVASDGSSTWAEEAGLGTPGKARLAEILLTLADALGANFVPSVRTICSAATLLLRDGALQSIAAAAVATPLADMATLGTNVKQIPIQFPDQHLTESVDLSVTLEAMDLAQSALEDFVSSYFMFHNLDADSTTDIFRYLPALAFVESYIYSLDQTNEDTLLVSSKGAAGGTAGALLADDPFDELRQLLRQRGWLTPRIESELKDGGRFWSLERQLCRAMLSGAEGDSGAAKLEQCDVKEALRLKSFDYRVLNLLLYAMRHTEPDPGHMRFLAASELLVEIGDDLTDYDDDVMSNSFNVYRCFLAMHGPECGPQELMRFIRQAEAEYASELSRLTPTLAASWQQRCQAKRRHGAGSERGPGGGDWELPPPVDENTVRKQQQS